MKIREEHYINIDEITKGLDPNQKAGVTCPMGNTLVNSIAGSGKTTILTKRVAWMIAKNYNQEKILLLTFTNKASDEMLERVQGLVGGEMNITGGTFHSISAKILREFGTVLGYTRYFTILDSADSKALMADIREEYLDEIGVKKSEFLSTDVILSNLSDSINKNYPLEDLKYYKSMKDEDLTHFKVLVSRYKESKLEGNSMDFDDLIVNSRKLLDYDGILKELQDRYHYLLVDEFQDVNHLQYDFVEMINRPHQNLFVVGDRNQSIYKFRGSDIRYIQNFAKNFNAKVINSDINYRSTKEILDIATNSINNNIQIPDVVMNSHKGSGFIPEYYACQNEYLQAEFIASDIKSKLYNGVEPQEIAILVRGVFMTVKSLETALRKNRINYVLRAGYSYYETKHVKDIVAFLTLLSNPKSYGSLIRVIKFFTKGKKGIQKAINFYKMSGNNISLFKDNIEDGTYKVSKKIKEELLPILEVLSAVEKDWKVDKIISFICSEFYYQHLHLTDAEADFRIEELGFLISLSENFSNIEEFLEEVVLDSGQDENEQKDDNKSKENSIILSTIHRSKGLEWDYVYMPFMNDEIFPKKSALSNDDELEEERRLNYVGITRARKELKLLSVNEVAQFKKYLKPSVFMNEINRELYKKKYITY